VGDERVRFKVMAAVVAAAVLALAVAPAGHALAVDPRAAQIKARLEYFGLKVLRVEFAAATTTAPPVWAATTAASYEQPSWDKVTDQAMTVWNVMFAVLKTEDPKTIFAAPQDWKTYRLFVSTKLGDVAAFDAGLRAAKTDAEKLKAIQTLYKTINFRVFDLQAQKMIDDKEFVKAHFKP
jgi:hypothetical protein